MKSLIDAIVEKRIREAQARGEFDDLPGTGAPLDLENHALVPEELRAAYRVLKNSGFLPQELQERSEIGSIEQLLQHVEDGDERVRLIARIEFLLARSAAGHRRVNLAVEQAYWEQFARRLESRRRS